MHDFSFPRATLKKTRNLVLYSEKNQINWRLRVGNRMVNEKKPVIADKTREELLWALMDNIPDSIYFKNGDNRFIMVSKIKAEHVGSTPEDIIGKTDFDFYPEEIAEKMAEDDKHVVETGESIVDRIEKIVRRSGKVRWVSATKVPLRDKTGAIIGTMGISRDITEIKRAEEELRKSEQRYRALFESALDGVFVIDAETMRVVLANEAVANLFGFDSVKDVIGMNPLDFVPPDDRDRVTQIIVEDMFAKDLRQVNEFRTITRDGREIWIRAVGARIEYQGKLAGLVSLHDITELKRAEEERMRAAAVEARLEAERLAAEAAAKITEAVRLVAEKYRAKIEELEEQIARLKKLRG
jgi:two-component system sensor histidine kinase/response regulator